MSPIVSTPDSFFRVCGSVENGPTDKYYALARKQDKSSTDDSCATEEMVCDVKKEEATSQSPGSSTMLYLRKRKRPLHPPMKTCGGLVRRKDAHTMR